MQAGIRGAQHSPEGQWGTLERDTWFPWQPDRMEPLSLVMRCRDLKEVCFDWTHPELFGLMFVISLAIILNYSYSPFNTPTRAQQPGHRRLIPSLLHYTDMLCFQHVMLWSAEKINLFVLLQLRFHNDWIHMQKCPCMLKLSPKFKAVSCVSTRGAIWCGSEGLERTPNWFPLAVYLGGCAAAGMTEGFNLNIYKHLVSDV